MKVFLFNAKDKMPYRVKPLSIIKTRLKLTNYLGNF